MPPQETGKFCVLLSSWLEKQEEYCESKSLLCVVCMCMGVGVCMCMFQFVRFLLFGSPLKS